jgi:aspartyl-tRNA synthetase
MDEEDKQVAFCHNPFSMPQGGMEALQTQDPLTIKAFQYDMVCNGFEIASGSIRNHSPKPWSRPLKSPAWARTWWKRSSAACTAPSSMAHRPMAAWPSAWTGSSCFWWGRTNLREITLFPMNQQAQDLLMGAPSDSDAQNSCANSTSA